MNDRLAPLQLRRDAAGVQLISLDLHLPQIFRNRGTASDWRALELLTQSTAVQYSKTAEKKSLKVSLLSESEVISESIKAKKLKEKRAEDKLKQLQAF